MYDRFGLVLVVNHACNLRCDYCYTGEKFVRAMSAGMARKAIDRAVRSVGRGGVLELGFFGGEPLVEVGLVGEMMEYAESRCAGEGKGLALSMTTNGTIARGEAWGVMARPGLELAVSFDGTPEVHDRHRRTAEGKGTSAVVMETMRRLMEVGKDFRVVMVVRPDSVEEMVEGILFLKEFGVAAVEPSLDLWARWTAGDVRKLEKAVALAARVWAEGIPDFGVSWFDEKAAGMVGMLDKRQTARCGFGAGEIAVTPAGRLYPCERLVGEDREDDPMRLPGDVWDGEDFLKLRAAGVRCEEECASCRMESVCNTDCRCGNYVRTGNVGRPDGLLCAWNQACLVETARVMKELVKGKEVCRAAAGS